MNKARRKEIHMIQNKLCCFQNDVETNKLTKEEIESVLDTFYSDIESVHWDEEYYMDNGIPENMQGGSKYEAAEEACDNLENAMDSVNEAKKNIGDVDEMLRCIDDIINYLDDAAM